VKSRSQKGRVGTVAYTGSHEQLDNAPKRSSKLSRPNVPRGTLVTGRIVNLLMGQCHGFIRLPNAREICFHRADLQEGTAFNDLQIGDAVTFELLADSVSGAGRGGWCDTRSVGDRKVSRSPALRLSHDRRLMFGNILRSGFQLF